MNSTVVVLPFSTSVNVRAVTNATLNQQVIVQPESGQATTWTGTGEGDHQIGATTIQTPASGKNPRGYGVTVQVNSWINGQWTPSNVLQGSCGVMYYNAVLVASEDYVDADWNDAVVFFTWWEPPSARELEDFEIEPKSSKDG
ncbi:MAG: fucose-binding lectin II [Actinomycetota bacterium]|nr:fucose-binding lectin II [Actinomycetota bacterium]